MLRSRKKDNYFVYFGSHYSTSGAINVGRFSENRALCVGAPAFALALSHKNIDAGLKQSINNETISARPEDIRRPLIIALMKVTQFIASSP